MALLNKDIGLIMSTVKTELPHNTSIIHLNYFSLNSDYFNTITAFYSYFYPLLLQSL